MGYSVKNKDHLTVSAIKRTDGATSLLVDCCEKKKEKRKNERISEEVREEMKGEYTPKMRFSIATFVFSPYMR